MSQETSIDRLGGNSMNSEDSQLVDSILKDLNSEQSGQQQMGQQQMGQQQMGQQQMGQQQMRGPQGQIPISPEQHRAMLQQRQQAMMQQQAMQQQAMQQQAMQKAMLQNNNSESILDKLQSDWKNILSIIVLSVLMNTSFIESLFKINDSTYFILEDGTLNFQATVLKALFIGILYFFISRSF